MLKSILSLNGVQKLNKVQQNLTKILFLLLVISYSLIFFGCENEEPININAESSITDYSQNEKAAGSSGSSGCSADCAWASCSVDCPNGGASCSCSFGSAECNCSGTAGSSSSGIAIQADNLILYEDFLSSIEAYEVLDNLSLLVEVINLENWEEYSSVRERYIEAIESQNENIQLQINDWFR
jgi:hypothetical protein